MGSWRSGCSLAVTSARFDAGHVLLNSPFCDVQGRPEAEAHLCRFCLEQTAGSAFRHRPCRQQPSVPARAEPRSLGLAALLPRKCHHRQRRFPVSRAAAPMLYSQPPLPATSRSQMPPTVQMQQRNPSTPGHFLRRLWHCSSSTCHKWPRPPTPLSSQWRYCAEAIRRRCCSTPMCQRRPQPPTPSPSLQMERSR